MILVELLCCYFSVKLLPSSLSFRLGNLSLQRTSGKQPEVLEKTISAKQNNGNVQVVLQF